MTVIPINGVAEEKYQSEERAAISGQPPAPVWKSPATRARGLGLRGVRLPTCFPTLDKATRGGPLSGRVIVIGGAPGAGKTTFVLQLGRHYTNEGYSVAIVAADEEGDGLIIRYGQQEGCRREDLEAGVPEAREWLAERFEDLPNLILVDQEEEDAPLEAIAAELVRRANGKPAVLIIDSIQTVCAMGTAEARTPRDRVDYAVVALKHAAKKQGLLVIATSELARGAYRSKSSSDQIEDLAAFKESGGIEYGAGTAIILRNVPKEPDLVAVSIAKNRLGEKLEFTIKIDRLRASFTEVTGIAAPDLDEESSAKFDALCGRVLALLRKDTTLASASAVARRLGGNKSKILLAVKDLVESGRVRTVDNCLRVVVEATS